MSYNILDSATNTKNNIDGVTNSVSILISPKESIRVRSKLTEIYNNGVLLSVILPNDELIEKLYESNHIDILNSSGTFSLANNNYTLLNTQFLQSSIISYEQNKALKKVTMIVSSDISGLEMYVDYGDGLLAVNNNVLENNNLLITENGDNLIMNGAIGFVLIPIKSLDITDSFTQGDNLSANLDMTLSGVIFPNKLRYKIINNTGVTVTINEIYLKLEFY